MLGERVHNVSLAAEIEHFQSLEVREAIELAVHHVEHALVDDLVLVFDGRKHALVEGKMDGHVDLLLSLLFVAAHLDLFLVAGVLIYNPREFVPDRNLWRIELSLLPLLVRVFDLGVLLPQIPDSPLMRLMSILVNGAPHVVHQRLRKSSTNYVHCFTRWRISLGLCLHLLVSNRLISYRLLNIDLNLAQVK